LKKENFSTKFITKHSTVSHGSIICNDYLDIIPQITYIKIITTFSKFRILIPISKKVWRYQKGKQKPSLQGQTIQWPIKNGKKDKKSKDQATRTPLKTKSERVIISITKNCYRDKAFKCCVLSCRKNKSKKKH